MSFFSSRSWFRSSSRSLRGPLSITAVASFAALVAGGCATLPAIEAGTCGNGIVEASEGEDCESLLEGRIASRDKAMSLDSNLHHCGRSSGEGAARAPESCRFTCDRAAPATKACPESRVCGADGICREPSGGFGRVESVPAEGVALSAADFDGDGRAELVATGRRNIEVVTWDKATRLLERMTRIGSRTVRPTAGSFGAKEQAQGALADLAVIREGGLVSLFRGTKGRDLEPQFFAAFKSNGTNFQLIPVDVLPGRIAGTTPLEYGLEVLVYVTRTKSDGTVVNELNFLDATLNQFTLATTPKSAAELAGPLRVGRFHDYVGVPVAQFDQVLPCESLVLPFRGDDSVTLIEPCRRKGATVEANTLGPDYVPTPALKLDDGFRVGPKGVHLFDLNDDGHLDVIVDGEKTPAAGGGRQTLVAFGLGDGRFHGVGWAKGAPEPSTPDGTARPSDFADCEAQLGFPLAYGQLTSDRQVDCVFAAGIRYRAQVERWLAAGKNESEAFQEAIVTDFNGDGRADVVTTSKVSLDTFASNGGFAFRSSFDAIAPRLAAAGDVDGDFVNDILFSANVDDQSALLLLRGGRFFSEAPTSLGKAPGMLQVLTGAVSNPIGGLDDVTDIGVVWKNAPGGDFFVSLFRGSTKGEFDAPFAVSADGRSQAVARVLAAGRFTAGARDSLAVVASDTGTSTERLFHVPFEEGAAPGKMEPSDPLDGAYEWARANLVAMKQEGAPSAVAMLVPPAAGGEAGAVFVARVEGGRFTVTRAATVAHKRRDRTSDAISDDFNGDGHPDLALVVEDDAKRALLVSLGTGGASLSPFVEVPMDKAPRAVAAVRLSGKRRRELVVLSDDTVRPVLVDGAPRLGDPLIEGVDDRATALVGADFDGDGVDDVAVGGLDGVEVHFGRAVLP